MTVDSMMFSLVEFRDAATGVVEHTGKAGREGAERLRPYGQPATMGTNPASMRHHRTTSAPSAFDAAGRE